MPFSTNSLPNGSSTNPSKQSTNVENAPSAKGRNKAAQNGKAEGD